MARNCKNVKGRVVCGSLSKGGVAGKTGVYLLHKGEQVVGKKAMAKLKKQGKDAVKNKVMNFGKSVGKKIGKKALSKARSTLAKRKGAGGRKKKKCNCKIW